MPDRHTRSAPATARESQSDQRTQKNSCLHDVRSFVETGGCRQVEMIGFSRTQPRVAYRIPVSHCHSTFVI